MHRLIPVPLVSLVAGKDGKRETVEVQASVRPLSSGEAPAMHCDQERTPGLRS